MMLGADFRVGGRSNGALIRGRVLFMHPGRAPPDRKDVAVDPAITSGGRRKRSSGWVRFRGTRMGTHQILVSAQVIDIIMELQTR